MRSGVQPFGYLLDNARLWVGEYCDVFDLDHIDVLWNRRFIRTIAAASFDEEHCEAYIELSWKVYPVLIPPRRVEVVAHEICHIATWIHHGLEVQDHGPEWRHYMKLLGFNNASPSMPVDALSVKVGKS